MTDLAPRWINLKLLMPLAKVAYINLMKSIISNSGANLPQRTRSQVLRSFLGAVAMGIVVLIIGSVALLGTLAVGAFEIAIGLVFFLGASGVVGVGLWRGFAHSAFGWCNTVTLLRLAMVGIFGVGLIGGVTPSWPLFAFAIVTLSLDGVDGWLARREGLTSDFGARFDMEVDAIFALVLAVLAFSNGTAGAYVLILGLPSYLFLVAKIWLPWLDQPLPDLFSRKVVCVAQLLVLIGLQIPNLAQAIVAPGVVLVAAGLVWSFGRDIVWLARAR